jgi:predicted glutamine amidotransferase
MRSKRCRAPTATAWSDENLRYLCRHLRSHLFFAHVRAATGTPITRPNCHPFACGNWMFMHNGFVGNWSRLRRSIESLIPDKLYPARVGTTDSEAIFLAILGVGMERPVAAAENILHTISDLVSRTEPGDRFRFTAALSNGEDLYAFRYAVNDHANTLYFRETERGIVIVSEPLDRDHKNWVAVPENHVVVAPAGERARIVPLFHRHQEAAE